MQTYDNTYNINISPVSSTICALLLDDVVASDEDAVPDEFKAVSVEPLQSARP